MLADVPADGQADATDSTYAAFEDDIAPWCFSATEFDNIDDDIIREYGRVDPWGDDLTILSSGLSPGQTNADTSQHSAFNCQPWSGRGF